MKDRDTIWTEWKEAVNMTASELEDWLKTKESRAVGDSESGESTGHASGRRIVTLLGTRKDDLSDDDWQHMAKVVGYVNRHCAQVPDDPEGSRWAHSLKNWGHDPLKEDGCA